MRALIKLMLVLFIAFSMTFILMKVTGLISVEKVEAWLALAKASHWWYLAGLVVLLLFLDLFIAMPTLTIIIFSGYFLGHFHGAIVAILGITLAGVSGYFLSYRYGHQLVKRVIKDEKQQVQMRAQFTQYGVFMILFSRAMPILPEVSACMSGIVKMPFAKFIMVWLISSVPYVLIATYAGSISTLGNPKPAIITAIGLTSIMWLAWYILRRHMSRQAVNTNSLSNK